MKANVSALGWWSDEFFDEALEVGPVSGFPQFEHEVAAVADAGDIIAGELPWTGQTRPEIIDAFLIANNWRDAHAYPMRSIRRKIFFLMGKNGVQGVPAARLKRMLAIRKKLRRLKWLKLNIMQDVAGCRVVVPSIADVDKLVGLLMEQSGHGIDQTDDYIAKPKKDGYRSHHVMLHYQGKAAAAVFTGRRVEVQIRTQLQHSWATAVEAVGMFRGEDLKSEKVGSAEWLRLFQLMSAEIAMVERCPESVLVPTHGARVAEIKDLEQRLQAISMLNNLSNVVKWEETSVSARGRPNYYLISYNNDTDQVVVEPYYKSRIAVESYDKAERPDIASGVETKNIVLVEVDKMDNLRAAYPNYFGDVQLFTQNLKSIIGGKAMREYTVKPQESAPWVARQLVESLAWLRRSRFPRPKGS
jgi:hypothetical protein